MASSNPLKRSVMFPVEQEDQKVSKAKGNIQLKDGDYEMTKAEFIQKHLEQFDGDLFQLGQFYEKHIEFDHIQEPQRPNLEIQIEKPFQFGTGQDHLFCSFCNIKAQAKLLSIPNKEATYCFVCSKCEKVASLVHVKIMHCSWCSNWIPDNWRESNVLSPMISFNPCQIVCSSKCHSKFNQWASKQGQTPKWIFISSNQ